MLKAMLIELCVDCETGFFLCGPRVEFVPRAAASITRDGGITLA